MKFQVNDVSMLECVATTLRVVPINSRKIIKNLLEVHTFYIHIWPLGTTRIRCRIWPGRDIWVRSVWRWVSVSSDTYGKNVEEVAELEGARSQFDSSVLSASQEALNFSSCVWRVSGFVEKQLQPQNSASPPRISPVVIRRRSSFAKYAIKNSSAAGTMITVQCLRWQT